MDSSSVATSSSGQRPNKRNRRPGYCSICWCGDGAKGMHLQDCSDCGVLFHNKCYGREKNVEYDPSVRCWACVSVGTTVLGRDLDGQRQDVTITERPTECALCSVDLKDIPLAMHPLYDDHGTKGRQIVLKQNASGGATGVKAAWCHTLCAQFTCVYSATGGCVYGCTASGYYMGDDDVEVEDDERSVNTELARVAEDTVGIHHFVVVLPTWRGVNKWTKRLEEAKQQLTCYICKKNDNRPETLRFAVQCSTNDEKEVAGKDLHKSKDLCTQTVHVGCAVWQKGPKGNWPLHRQVYFFPGRGDIDPVADIYCFEHSKEICQHKDAWKSARYRRFPEPNAKFPPSRSVVAAAGSIPVKPQDTAALVTAGPAATSANVDNGLSLKRFSIIVPEPLTDISQQPASKIVPRCAHAAVQGHDERGSTTVHSPEVKKSRRRDSSHVSEPIGDTAAAAAAIESPKKRSKQSTGISVVPEQPSRSNGSLVNYRSSPVHWPVKKDWSKLFGGPNYDPTVLDLKNWDKIEPVNERHS